MVEDERQPRVAARGSDQSGDGFRVAGDEVERQPVLLQDGESFIEGRDEVPSRLPIETSWMVRPTPCFRVGSFP